MDKLAMKRVVRGPDGKPKIIYIDLITLQEVSNPEGYEIIGASDSVKEEKKEETTAEKAIEEAVVSENPPNESLGGTPPQEAGWAGTGFPSAPPAPSTQQAPTTNADNAQASISNMGMGGVDDGGVENTPGWGIAPADVGTISPYGFYGISPDDTPAYGISEQDIAAMEAATPGFAAGYNAGVANAHMSLSSQYGSYGAGKSHATGVVGPAHSSGQYSGLSPSLGAQAAAGFTDGSRANITPSYEISRADDITPSYEISRADESFTGLGLMGPSQDSVTPGLSISAGGYASSPAHGAAGARGGFSDIGGGTGYGGGMGYTGGYSGSGAHGAQGASGYGDGSRGGPADMGGGTGFGGGMGYGGGYSGSGAHGAQGASGYGDGSRGGPDYGGGSSSNASAAGQAAAEGFNGGDTGPGSGFSGTGPQ